MVNQLVTECAKSPKTFKNCREFLVMLLGSPQKVIQLEQAHVNVTLEYYIKYIEQHNIDFDMVMSYYAHNSKYDNYWQLLINSVIGFFRRSETNNLDFLPF